MVQGGIRAFCGAALILVIFMGLAAAAPDSDISELAVDEQNTATEPAAVIDPVQLDQEIQQIKNDVLTLGNDLAMLDSGILSMAGNPLVIYVSMDIDEGFTLQAVDLELNDKFVSRREFNDRALQGLQAGGIRRLFVENLPAGKYHFKATMYGKIGKGRDHVGSLSFTVEKTERSKALELSIINFRQKYVPEFALKEWE